MVTSNLEQYTVADFIQWNDEKRLILNPHFQRNKVWTAPAKTYLIDTILLKLPIPKIYLRSKVDLKTKKSIREVVDGQQRLSAILEFAKGDMRLSTRSADFSGLTYDGLSDDQKETFLSYALSVDNLMNATDDDVLAIFGRLNSYGVKLNAAEKRHAEFQGDFKWTVHSLTTQLRSLWDNFDVLSVSQRARMADYALVAECLGVILDGVTDGGENRINKTYATYDRKIPDRDNAIRKFSETMALLTGPLAPSLTGRIAKPAHFLMLFAAAAHGLHGIPLGQLRQADFPPPRLFDPARVDMAKDNLLELSAAISNEDPPEHLEEFVEASSASTQRISSRRIRFPYYYTALVGE